MRHYVSALRTGYEEVRDSGLIRLETLLAVQGELERNRAGLRKLPGTVLKNEATGQTIYEPPQDAAEVESLMSNLIDFIHADDGLDPLLRGVAVTSRSAITVVKAFRDLMQKTKHDLRERLPKIYSQDLLNNLFRYPYTKIEIHRTGA